MSSEIGLLTQSSPGVSSSEAQNKSTPRKSSQDSTPSIFAKKLQDRRSTDSAKKPEPKRLNRPAPQPETDQTPTAEDRSPIANSVQADEQNSKPESHEEPGGDVGEIALVTSEAQQPFPQELPTRQIRLVTDSVPTQDANAFQFKAPSGFVAQYTSQNTGAEESSEATATDEAHEIDLQIDTIEINSNTTQTDSSSIESDDSEVSQRETDDGTTLENSSDLYRNTTIRENGQNRSEAVDNDAESAGSPQVTDDFRQNNDSVPTASEIPSETFVTTSENSSEEFSTEVEQEPVEPTAEVTTDQTIRQATSNPATERPVTARTEPSSAKPNSSDSHEVEEVDSQSSQHNSSDTNSSGYAIRPNDQLETIVANPRPEVRKQVAVDDVDSNPTETKSIDSNSSSSEALPPVTNRTSALAGREVTSPQTEGTESASRVQALVDRVAEAVETASRQQSTRPLRIRLDPPELGVLSIEVHNQGGQVSARLQVESSAAQRLLLEHLPQLQDALTQQTGGTTQVEVQRGEPSNSDSQQHGFAQDQSNSRQQQERHRQTGLADGPTQDSPEKPDEINQTTRSTEGKPRRNDLVGIDIEV